jgi:ribosome-binding factor A
VLGVGCWVSGIRSIPQLTFYQDDTLDYVFKMEKLLDEIKSEDEKRSKSE